MITLRLFLGEQVKSRSLVRDRERFARSRRSNQEAAIHRLVQGAHHQEPQRPPGGSTQETECWQLDHSDFLSETSELVDA